jgi:hypothetical protein
LVYINANKNITFTYVIVDQVNCTHTPLQYLNIDYISFKDFKYEDYDDHMSIGDSYWYLVANRHGLPNLSNKNELKNQLAPFNILTPKQFDFVDNDLVFPKPNVGSGSYKKYPKHYTPCLYKEVKDYQETIIQEYLDPFVNSIYLYANGTDLTPITTGELYCSHVENKGTLILGAKFINYNNAKNETAKKLLEFGYANNLNKVNAIYNIQMCVDKDGNDVVIDFNTRCGPIILEGEIHGNLNLSMFKFNYSGKHSDYHIESRLFQDGENKCYKAPPINFREIVLNDNKESGQIRSDYDTHIYY